MAVTGWPRGTSKTAVTWPCSRPWRTRPASPRPPSASAKASRRMDLPAPVSPVRTARPRENSISSRSIRTMSRIDRRASMRGKTLTETEFLEGFRNVGARVLTRLNTAGLYKIIGVFVPAAIRKIVPQHGRRGLGLADDADRHIGFGQPRQRLLDMPGGLVLRDYVVTQYQTTRHVEEALARLTEAYMAIGIVGEAQTAAAVLGHNFPDSRWYKDAYNLVKSGGVEPSENTGSYISKAFKKLGLG